MQAFQPKLLTTTRFGSLSQAAGRLVPFRPLASVASTSPKELPCTDPQQTMQDLQTYFTKPKSLHPYINALRQRYKSDVFKLWTLQTPPMAILCDPDDYFQVLRAEWNMPYGTTPASWTMTAFYKTKGYSEEPGGRMPPFGVMVGDNWKSGRHKIQKEIFNRQQIDSYVPQMDEVAHNAIRYIKKKQSGGNLVDLNSFSTSVAFEMIAKVLLGYDIGLLTETASDDAKSLVQSSVQAFHLMAGLLMKTPEDGMKTPEWQGFLSSWGDVHDKGAKLLEESKKHHADSVFKRLIAKDNMPQEMLVTELAGLLGAGVDTTSATMENCIWALARYPHVQKRLREEVLQVAGRNGPVDGEKLQEMHYMKAVLREQHRLHFVAASIPRLVMSDVTLRNGEYVLPKYTFVMFDSTSYNGDPLLVRGDVEQFLPERWLTKDGKYDKPRMSVRDASDDDKATNSPTEGESLGIVSDYRDLQHGSDSRPVQVFAPSLKLKHPLIETPFGLGPRQCVGGRLATLEVQTLLTELVRNFDIGGVDENTKTEGLQILVRRPTPDPNIRFTPRL
jgi:cytochrome P450